MLSRHYPLVQVVWFPYASHLAILVAVCAWPNPQRVWRTRRLPFQLARSMCMLLMPLSFVAALSGGSPLGMTWSLFWVAPLLVVLLAAQWLPESVDRPAARLALVVSCGCNVGTVLMLWPRKWPVPGLWPLAALAMALSMAVYVVMTRSLREEALAANLFYSAFGAFTVLSPVMPAVWVTPTPHDAVVLAGIGAIGLPLLLALDRAAAAAPLPLSAAEPYAHLPFLVLASWALHDIALPGRLAMAAMMVVLLAWLWRHLPAAPASSAISRP